MKLLMPNFDDLSLIKTGDMPGDKVEINEKHIKNAGTIIEKLDAIGIKSKSLISVHGGSGVGKSETASILGHILNHNGLNTYILSGDNYPRRIPSKNDQERLRVFREFALKGLVKSGQYSKENRDIIFDLMENEDDLNEKNVSQYPFLEIYIEEGKKGLSKYLGTSSEIDFDEINAIIGDFKSGKKDIYLKRMGRSDHVLWYDKVDFSDIDVLIVEWTHGNNKNLEGVDIPILLNSTPEETLAHRLSRSRDGKVDSPFVSIVLELEQKKIFEQSHLAKIIVSKSGDYIPYEAYLELMGDKNEK
ncbi:adenylylsulfate kinase [Acidaminobacter sp. JC074]|uniref:adenylylsulfate kinase n=1 Tax=Acidaminobacter sp. JC074 TaxID=2530199 RepID=UPI001F0DF321|nr:adenylylsulfate kinase [Acidaminobacter sp. JC074]MCH4890842.1 adenylylsulfate kinase [Acidaminobacter sp. JC074]